MELEQWLQAYLQMVQTLFGERICCVGLQGSYGRGEAGADSDIDVVLILDRVSDVDLKRYRQAADRLQQREKLCGFVSGRVELEHWDRAELVSFYYDTVPLQGNLDFLLPLLHPADVRRAVLTGACGIYHACSHNFLHEQSPELVLQLQKAAFFTLRVAQFERTGMFVKQRRELLPLLRPEEQRLLQLQTDWQQMSDWLLQWSSQMICAYGVENNGADSGRIPVIARKF